MKIFVFIAFVAVLGCIALEGYGHRHHHNHHPPHFERFEHEQHGSHRHLQGPYHNHLHHHTHFHEDVRPPPCSHRHPQGSYHNNLHHHTHSHEDVRPPPWIESGESSDESNSNPDYDSYESSDEKSWHNSRHHHCNGWRCPPKTTRKQERTNTPKPTVTWAPKPNKTDETRTTTSLASDMAITNIPQWDITTFAPSPTIWFIPGDTTHSQTQSPSTIKEQSPTDTTLPSSRPTKSTWYPSNEQTTRLPTTTSSLGTTTEKAIISNIVSKCLDNCLSTPEYNPVCGTNGETYNNIGRLNCAKSCGIDVDLRQTSACPPPNFDDKGDRSNTTPPTLTTTAATSTSASVRGTNLKTFQNCLKQCPITSVYSPVCGTDRVTYMNIDRLKCAISCEKDVQILCDRPCAVCYETVKTTSTTLQATTQTASSGNIGRTNPSITIEQCIMSCPVTFENNLVCGSNGVTYTNPSCLLCAQKCGEDVELREKKPCNFVTTKIEQSASTTTTSSTSRSTILGGNKDTVPTQSMTDKVTSTPSRQSWDNLPTPPQTTRTPSSTTSQQLTDTTIPNDIIQGVFNLGPNFTSTQPTKAIPKKDSEYEYDIDPRFGNE